jgi:hypothetical protein
MFNFKKEKSSEEKWEELMESFRHLAAHGAQHWLHNGGPAALQAALINTMAQLRGLR